MTESHEGLTSYKRRSKFKIFAFIFFVGIVVLLIYTAFSGRLPITGNIVGDVIVGNDSNLIIQADLTVPEIKLDGDFSSVEIEGSSSGFLYVGNQKVELGNSGRNFISMENFDGTIEFNTAKILRLKGRASQASVNGIPFTSATNKSTKVSFNEEFSYNSLDISNDVHIKNLVYLTTGVIRLDNDKIVLNVNNEEINIRGFVGSLSSSKDKFKLNGVLNKLIVEGETFISVD
ncbi:MAG: hypothetical protein ACE5ES_01140 [Candidatus Nanoarchaeia archaeon]